MKFTNPITKLGIATLNKLLELVIISAFINHYIKEYCAVKNVAFI